MAKETGKSEKEAMDEALGDVEEAIGVDQVDEGEADELGIDGEKAEPAKSPITTEILKLDRKQRVDYVNKLFSRFKGISNLKESIRNQDNETLGEELKRIDKIYDSGNIEFAAEWYRYYLNLILKIIEHDYVRDMRHLLGLVIQLLNEFETINKKAEDLLVDETKRNESLVLEITKLRAEHEILKNWAGKMPLPAPVSLPEATSNGEKAEGNSEGNGAVPDDTDKFDEEHEKLRSGFDGFARKSKNPVQALTELLKNADTTDKEKEVLKELIIIYKEKEREKAEAEAKIKEEEGEMS